MISFYIVVLAAPVLIIGVRNSVSKFGEAYWQALLFLEVMNIYDSVVIDKLWVGHEVGFGCRLNLKTVPVRIDLTAGAEKLKGMGFADMRYVKTAETIFGSRQRVATMMPSDSAMIVGRDSCLIDR